MLIRRFGKLSRCDIRWTKKLDFGLCMLYLCCREVRLHLSITFENEFSSSAFGLHWHCLCNKGSTAALISCTLVLTDGKTVFLIYSFSVLWYFVTTESKVGRYVWNLRCIVEYYHTLLRLSHLLTLFLTAVWWKVMERYKKKGFRPFREVVRGSFCHAHRLIESLHLTVTFLQIFLPN